MVYHVAWTFTEDTGLSEDIVQDVFTLIWKNREKLPEIQDIKAYLYVTAKHRALRVLQKIAATKKLDRSFGAGSQLIESGHNDLLSEEKQMSLLHEALHLLSPQQRTVFRLSRMEGLDREAIAQQLGISKATVSVHLTISLRVVRAFLVSKLEVVAALALFPEFF